MLAPLPNLVAGQHEDAQPLAQITQMWSDRFLRERGHSLASLDVVEHAAEVEGLSCGAEGFGTTGLAAHRDRVPLEHRVVADSQNVDVGHICQTPRACGRQQYIDPT